MAEDKRVLKTKGNLQKTLQKLLKHKSIESITVTEICDAAQTSRITFYAHYADKYELADELIESLMQKAENNFLLLEEDTNPQKDPITEAENLLKAALDLYEENSDMFEHASESKYSYIDESFRRKLMNKVQMQVKKVYTAFITTADVKRISALMTGAMVGFIRECKKQKLNFDALKKESCRMLRHLIVFSMPTLAAGV